MGSVADSNAAKYGFYLIPPNIFFKICLPNMDFNAASQRLVRFSLPAQLSACSNHDFPYLKYFDMHRDSRVREGDDAGRIPPFATRLLGTIAALTKYKYASVALNNVNGGGKTN